MGRRHARPTRERECRERAVWHVRFKEKRHRQERSPRSPTRPNSYVYHKFIEFVFFFPTLSKKQRCEVEMKWFIVKSHVSSCCCCVLCERVETFNWKVKPRLVWMNRLCIKKNDSLSIYLLDGHTCFKKKVWRVDLDKLNLSTNIHRLIGNLHIQYLGRCNKRQHAAQCCCLSERGREN